MSINSYYVLMWESAATLPAHPAPMIGKQSFASIFDAIKFFNNLSSNSTFISLTFVQKTETDFSEVFEKFITEEKPKPEFEMCSYCMGSGIGGHPDSGHLCWFCNGLGGKEKESETGWLTAQIRAGNYPKFSEY